MFKTISSLLCCMNSLEGYDHGLFLAGAANTHFLLG